VCAAAGGATERTMGAAGGGIAGATGAGAGGDATAGAGATNAPPPTLPVCARASGAMAASISAVVKTRNPTPGMHISRAMTPLGKR
jgi:hypothetical protein